MTLLTAIKDDFTRALTDLKTTAEDAVTLLSEVPLFIKALEDSHQIAVAELADQLEPIDGKLAAKLKSRLGDALVGNTLPSEGDSELGYILHYLAYPNGELDDLSAASELHPDFDTVWRAFKAAAPNPITTAEDLDAVKALLSSQKDVLATNDGTILGFSQYEQLDARWGWTAVNRLLNWLCGIHKFNTTEKLDPIKLTSLDPGQQDEIKVAVIGDWGTGIYTEHEFADPDGPAAAVMKTVVAQKPDYIIHVGDTYYAGTGGNRPPKGEEQANLVDLWQKIVGDDFPAGRYFTLNSNHEMYGGAFGLYDVALKDPLFSAQNNLTYFSLRFGKWLIGGFDSAYYSPSITYLNGGLGDEAKDPAQHKFLRQFKKRAAEHDLKTMLMCHHNAIDTFGNKVKEPLWSDVTDIVTPDYWYWGHIHMGAAYSDEAAVWGKDGGAKGRKTKARCIGHSAIPIAVPWGFEAKANHKNQTWYAKTMLDGGEAVPPMHLPAEFQPRIKNGFAVLTLHKDGRIKEEAFDEGDNTGVDINKKDLETV
jgi:hypothetical protein